MGHTGYLAEKLGVRDERMAFLTPDYMLALQTTHIPLGQVSGHLKLAGIVTSLKMLHRRAAPAGDASCRWPFWASTLTRVSTASWVTRKRA